MYDIVNKLPSAALSLSGLATLHFRLRFDRSILKTIDEEEYVSAYSSRSPARRNVTMVLRRRAHLGGGGAV